MKKTQIINGHAIEFVQFYSIERTYNVIKYVTSSHMILKLKDNLIY